MTFRDKISLAATLVLSIFCYLPLTAHAQADVVGTYKCSGYDPLLNDPNFKENLVLKKANNDTYKVELLELNSVLPYFIGTAIFNKNIPNAFAFVYWDPHKPDKMGAEFVIINSDGSLDAVFANANKSVAGNERCVKV